MFAFTSSLTGACLLVAMATGALALDAVSARAPKGSAGVWTNVPRLEDAAQKWTLSTREGDQTCDFELSRHDDIGAAGVVSGLGCPDGFFNVVSWELSGIELRMLSPTGRVLARFYRTSLVRWDGERENDGAPMVLLRRASDDF